MYSTCSETVSAALLPIAGRERVCAVVWTMEEADFFRELQRYRVVRRATDCLPVCLF